MREIFNFDQDDLLEKNGTFSNINLIPEFAKYGEGVCLGLSQLWILTGNRAQTFVSEVKKVPNQRKVASWMDAQDTILSLIHYDYNFEDDRPRQPVNKTPMDNVNTPQGRMNTRKAFDERRQNLSAWATDNNLTLADDIYRFGHVITYSKQNDCARYRKAFADSVAEDVLHIIKTVRIGLIAFTGEDSGHACGFEKSNAADTVSIFDPNYGEYSLRKKAEISTFLHEKVVNGLELDEHWWIVGFN